LIDELHDLGVVAVGLRLGVDVLDIVGDALLLFLEALDALDEKPQLIRGYRSVCHVVFS
jgi:hypothetical protein